MALSADYEVYPNGTLYHGAVEVAEASEYFFYEPGMMGQRVSLQVSGVLLKNESGVVEFEESGSSEIKFPTGNYTVEFDAPLKDNYFNTVFSEPYEVTLHLPSGLNVGNPLLGMISTGGKVSADDTNASVTNGSVTIHWEKTRSPECRFYNEFQEQLLIIFGTLWLALLAVFLVPYMLARRRQE